MQAVQPALRHDAACGTAPWHARCEAVGSRDRVRWHGAALPRPRAAGWHRTAAHRAEPPAAALRARAPCRLQRVERFRPAAKPLQQDAARRRQHRIQRIASAATSSHASSASSEPASDMRRRPDAARIPASEATDAAPRQTPIQRAACHRSAAAQVPRCPTPRRARARCRSSAAADRRAVSPSPRMINRPASPSSAASRRGLISRTRPIGLFRLGHLPGGAQQLCPPQSRFVPVGQPLFQPRHQPNGAFQAAGPLLGERQVQQCRR